MLMVIDVLEQWLGYAGLRGVLGDVQPGKLNERAAGLR